jgi:hypothetical protein
MQTQDDFRRTIKPGLDVSIDGLTFVTGRTKVDDFDLWGWKPMREYGWLVKIAACRRMRQKDLLNEVNRMFSGLRSQWMRCASLRTVNASSNWLVNTLTRLVLSPLNEFCLMSSYRFEESSSKTRQRWLWWMKVSFIRRMWCLFSGSQVLLSCGSRGDSEL